MLTDYRAGKREALYMWERDDNFWLLEHGWRVSLR